MHEAILARGTLIQVTSYGPWWGRKGTIRAVDLMDAPGPSPAIFYLVVVHGPPCTELWLEHDSVPLLWDTQILEGCSYKRNSRAHD